MVNPLPYLIHNIKQSQSSTLTIQYVELGFLTSATDTAMYQQFTEFMFKNQISQKIL